MNICFDMPQGGRFNYRVGAVIIRDGRLLAVKNEGSDTYYTVGGRVQFGESLEESLLREAREELGIPLEIERLVFIHENFFTLSEEQIPFHELAFFFLMKPHEGLADVKADFDEPYGKVSISWLPLDKLDEYKIYPEFFKKELRDIPANIKHIVTREG